jgi:dienelactone hydrolase
LLVKGFPIVLSAIVLISYAHSWYQEPGKVNSDDLGTQARTFVGLLAGKDFSAAEKYFDDTMKMALPKAKLEETWNTVIAQAGVFKTQVSTRTEQRGGYAVLIVTCEFDKALVDIEVVFNQAKQVAGLFFKAAASSAKYTPPDYAKTNAFREEDVDIGTGEWTLPGTLTLPLDPKSPPVVILVHGSGPHDRDETIGPNKPFRDLSWGLASKGMAVLRYEKRTKQHNQKLASLKGITVKEETIDDVIAAVTFLRKRQGIDAKKIFVLGHSLGGTLVPRFAKADPSLAGFIVLAGAVKPLEDAIVEQTTYILSIDGVISKEEQVQLDELKQLAAKVRALKPADADSSTNLLGVPPSYWLDLRGYDPPSAAKSLTQPMLILNGERDYQVSMDDFRLWQSALSSRKNVLFKSYPKLNHLFIEGSGKSTPAEYATPGNVAEQVIIDIANWIKEWSARL